ncbi:MAG: HoxN/HupN/NixA family nickel/cobalt transporter [Actinomycetota bacterium]
MRRLLLVFVLCWLLAVPAVAGAHPLGNFTINQYLGVMISADSFDVEYVLDMAEIPAFQEQRIIDLDGDEVITMAEENAYRTASCLQLASGLSLSLNGRNLTLEPANSTIAFPPGQAGLSTLRLECSYAAMGSGSTLWIENKNYSERIGWREIVVGSTGVSIDSDLPASSSSDRLTAYPMDPGRATPDVRDGTVTIGGAGNEAESATVTASPLGRTPVDALGTLITRGDLGIGPALLALGAALVLGAGHALAPGHGKTIMAAYLVGNRGSVRMALGLGLSVAVSHTLGVAALGAATLFATRSFQPELIYPYLSAAAAVIVLAVGVGLLVRSARRMRHNHQHQHGREHHHDHHEGHHHHHHEMAPAPGWKTLVAVGLTGGLVPSASAVVLLLGAVNLGRVEFGLGLVAAFGVGMALAMMVVGVGMVAITRLGLNVASKASWLPAVKTALPAAMGVIVTIVGTAMVLSAASRII